MPPYTMNLELMAMHFLRFEKACPVALFERSPRLGHGQPDVLGITKRRYLLEIEVKRSLSDFRANSKKRHMYARDNPGAFELDYYAPRWPKQFWFLVPCEMVKKVEPLVPAFAGLMRGPGRNESQGIRVIKPSPVNQQSARLTVKEVMRLGHCMANQIWSQANTIQTLRGRFQEGHFEWNWCPTI